MAHNKVTGVQSVGKSVTCQHCWLALLPARSTCQEKHRLPMMGPQPIAHFYVNFTFDKVCVPTLSIILARGGVFFCTGQEDICLSVRDEFNVSRVSVITLNVEC